MATKKETAKETEKKTKVAAAKSTKAAAKEAPAKKETAKKETAKKEAAKKEAEVKDAAKAEAAGNGEKNDSSEEEEYDIMKEFGLNPDGTPMKKSEDYPSGNDDTNELLMEELARSRERKTVVDVKAKKPFMKVEEKTEAESIMASFSEQVVKNAEEGIVITEESKIDEDEQKKDKKKKK